MKLRHAGLIAAAAAMIGLAGASTATAGPAAMGLVLGNAAAADASAETSVIPVQAEHGGYGRNLEPGANGAAIWLPNNRNVYVDPWDGRRYHQRVRPRYERPRYERPPHRYRPRGGYYLEFGVPSGRYVAPRRANRGGNAHYRWCHERYKSYRQWDNSWKPYHGPRRQCISPFVR